MSDKHEWKVSYTDGIVAIRSDDFTHDAALYLSGDFATNEVAINYASKLAARLNADQASALRQVERETLERAAKVVEGYMPAGSAVDAFLGPAAGKIRALSPTPTEDATELLTTQELADVSTSGELVDRDKYVQVPWKEAIVATSVEADFEKRTWTFEPKGKWSVRAGDYYLIPVPNYKEKRAAMIQAAEKGE